MTGRGNPTLKHLHTCVPKDVEKPQGTHYIAHALALSLLTITFPPERFRHLSTGSISTCVDGVSET